MKEILHSNILEASDFIKTKVKESTGIGLILGSGLGTLGDEIDDKIIINYSDIPNFPKSTVEGHEGKLIIGKLEGRSIIAMQGRFHYYEGYTMQQVVFPIWVMTALGVKKIIITNAAGGINKSYNPGDLVILNDYINFFGDNPLIGNNIDEIGPRFPDMSNVFSLRMINIAKHCFEKCNIKINEGVYIGMTGPAYETPAEIRAARVLGADLVGMSTVPEVIAANHAGLEVLGISCVTNMAAGVLNQPLNHVDVVKTAESIKDQFALLIKAIIKEI